MLTLQASRLVRRGLFCESEVWPAARARAEEGFIMMIRPEIGGDLQRGPGMEGAGWRWERLMDPSARSAAQRAEAGHRLSAGSTKHFNFVRKCINLTDLSGTLKNLMNLDSIFRHTAPENCRKQCLRPEVTGWPPIGRPAQPPAAGRPVRVSGERRTCLHNLVTARHFPNNDVIIGKLASISAG